ncbi:hypothetical protein BFJ67_g18269, partial [Fusarium oxysporum f. sp. cepae]
MPVYSADDLENAIADVKNGVSLKTAAKKNGLPPSTYEVASLVRKVVRSLAKNNYALLPIKKMTLSADSATGKARPRSNSRASANYRPQRSRASRGSRAIRKEVDYAIR